MEANEALKLSPPQRRLFEDLVLKGDQLAGMYFGALSVLRQRENPDFLALAAHGIRELMEKLPGHFDLPLRSKAYSLGNEVNQLDGQWLKTLANTACRGVGGWGGQIDRSIGTFLGTLEGFFERYRQSRPTRRQERVGLFRRLDPRGLPLPDVIEDSWVKQWDDLNGFFQGVAHHTRATSVDEFSARLAHLEQFLVDRLRPRTFEDHTALDQLIREGEADDNP